MADVLPPQIVCLVDDDSSVRKSVARLLESSGFKVETFGEPEAFLLHLATHAVPVAVLDIWMESITGMELMAHLCARSPETRTIFITGHEDHAAEAVVMAAGAFAFFLKPLEAARFLNAVHRAFTTPLPGALPQPPARGQRSAARQGRLGLGKNRSEGPSETVYRTEVER